MRYVFSMFCATLMLFSLGCSQGDKAESSSQTAATVEVNKPALAAFSPLPEEMALASAETTPAKIELGRMLYYEPRISKSHAISCNSCHGLNTFGVDNNPVSEGHKGMKGNRNSPTVYNAAGHIAQFWDGRAEDVIEQAKGPILNPVEMAMPGEDVVVATLQSIPGYVDAFKKAYPNEAEPITYHNMAEAIGVFETKLVTPARWDQFLDGDESALTGAEKAGFNKFVESGCNACHSGAYLGGHLYNKLGLVKAWPNVKDLGRYEVTKKDSDKLFFKVPSLRNITETGPYLHDGSVDDLPTMVAMMAEHQLGRELEEKDVLAITTFLGALTGEIPSEYVRKPALPPSGPNTPEPVLD